MSGLEDADVRPNVPAARGTRAAASALPALVLRSNEERWLMTPLALAQAEIRHRWRGVAAVGLVLGIGFAAVLAAAAGARRTQTAFPRMLVATGASQLLVSSGDEDQTARHRFYRRVAALDGVERMGIIAGIGLIPIRVPKGAGTEVESCANLSVDGVFGYAIDRPNVLDGRPPRPDRSDEVLVTKSYADTFGVRVGDRLDLVLHNGDSVPVAGEVAAAGGPVIRATIVGIGALTTQIVPVSDLEAAPTILAPPGLGKRYAPDQERWCYDGAVIALKPGADAGRVVADTSTGSAGRAATPSSRITQTTTRMSAGPSSRR